jgi:ABC-type transport system involved in multi-copper enzyme maturation permease subunit
MTYLVWRQHRNQFLFALAALAALGIVLVPTGVHLASAYNTARQSCQATGTCGDMANSLFRNYGILFDIIGLTAVVPALFGLFWGAPLIASEIEAGTHQLVWTQTITRRRWLAVKAAWLLAAAVWGAAVSTLVTWWSGPVNSVNQSRFNLGHFDTQSLVPVGYSVFAVALGITLGVLLRRVLPALALTLGVFAGLRFAVDYGLRSRYMTPLTAVLPFGSQKSVAGGSFWTVSSSILDPSGRTSGGIHLTPATVPPACRGLFGPDSGIIQCLGAHGWRTAYTFQPANRFWTFQAIETGIYVALAALVLVVAFRLVSRRDA